MLYNSKVNFLSQDELDIMHERVFELLRKRGVKMDHPKVLDLMSEGGAEVDIDNQRVRFSRELLEKSLALAPKKIELVGIDPSFDIEVPRPDGTFHLRTGTGARCYLDPESGFYRSTTISDISNLARLSSILEEVSFCAFPFPTDVPTATADIYALRAMLENSQKHVWVQPYSGTSLQYLIELATVVAKGEEALRKRPIISLITCSLTPLEFKFMDLEVILQGARRGIPLHACSLPSAGGTSPITLPSVVILAAAEILAMVAVAQLVQPGAAVIATPIIFTLDMQTGRSLQSSPEAIKGASLAIEFLKRAYRLPTHTYGSGSDSPDIDGQSMADRSLLGMLVALTGADILGGAGQVEVATTISPLQLIIDNEIAGMIRKIISGVTINDETMAWGDLLTHSFGHFLETEHTLRHCREVFKPLTFIRQTREIWENKGKKNQIVRTMELYKSLCEKAKPSGLPNELKREMDRIVNIAERYCSS